MSPLSQVILRNLDRIGVSRDILLVRPPRDDLALQLDAAGHHISILSHSYATHAYMRSREINSHFGVSVPENDKKFPLVILFQPREKALLEMMLAMVADSLDDPGELWLIGENKTGIKSAAKRLPEHFQKHHKIDSARHCQLFSASLPINSTPFQISAYSSKWSVDLAGETFTLTGFPGVFASGRLDDGTQLLLNALTDPSLKPSVQGRVLDFGCGSGVIGIALSRLSQDVEVTLLDDSALAIEASRLSAKDNHARVEVVASNGLDELLNAGHARYDWIISNPPFHSGVAQDLKTAQRFIENCPRLLTHQGRLCIVANNHLPYRRWLEELFPTVQVIASDRGYNVWLADNKSRKR